MPSAAAAAASRTGGTVPENARQSLASSEDDDDDRPRGPADRHRLQMEGLWSVEEPRTTWQIKYSKMDLHRRYVFLCPTSLSKQFDSLPHQAKDSALLVFRCSRSWLFQDRHRARVAPKIDCWSPQAGQASPRSTSSPSRTGNRSGTMTYQNTFSQEFLQWVVTKEKEDCVFWFKPERDLQKLSRFFEEKIDPVNEKPYRPLLLDPKWWRVHFLRTGARYVGNPAVVIAGIADAVPEKPDSKGKEKDEIDILALQELIYQSNPTLEPIVRWPHAPSMRFVPETKTGQAGSCAKPRTGYINSAPNTARQSTRIGAWPPDQHGGRLDSLHKTWQNQEAAVSRQHAFAMHGSSIVSSLPPLTAR